MSIRARVTGLVASNFAVGRIDRRASGAFVFVARAPFSGDCTLALAFTGIGVYNLIHDAPDTGDA